MDKRDLREANPFVKMDALASYSRESDEEEDQMDTSNGRKKNDRKPGT